MKIYWLPVKSENGDTIDCCGDCPMSRFDIDRNGIERLECFALDEWIEDGTRKLLKCPLTLSNP